VQINISGDEDRLVSIEVLRREHPEAHDYWDGNWLWCRVSVRAGVFRGVFEASLRAEEFATMRDGVRTCMTDFTGTFGFETMEGQVSVVAKGNGRGHFTAKCSARDAAGIGSELTFEMSFDQTRLAPLALELDALLRAYPVISPAA
jgi:hypothetical protein